MKDVKVLGSGCANCEATYKLVAEVAKAKGVEIQLQKISNIQEIITFGIMATPGVVVDGKVVHSGGMPSRSKVESWL